MSVRIDRRDVDRWVAKLDKATSEAPEEAAKVVDKGALNIKNDARRRWSGHPRLKGLPSAVTYDSWMGLRGPWAEIGPDKEKRQGALGNIAEFGTKNNAPLPAMIPAGEAEQPRFEQAMTDLAARLLEGS